MASRAELERQIRNTKPDPGRKIRIACGDGLSAVINKGGTKKFVSRLRLFNGGSAIDFAHAPPHPELTLSEAFKKHYALKEKISQGIDPRREQEEAALAEWSEPTFDEIAKKYLTYVEVESKLRDSTLNDYRNRYVRWLEPSFGQLKLKKIDGKACIRLLQKIKSGAGNGTGNKGDGKRTASICLTILNQIFSHAVFLGYVDVTRNPMLGITSSMLDIKQKHTGKLRRCLDFEELSQTWVMLSNHRAAGYLFSVTTVALQIALLTGMRRQEVVGMQYSELELLPDGAAIYHIPPERMKGGVKHRVYISSFGMSVIAGLPKTSDRVFQSPRTGEEYEARTITKNTLNNGVLSIFGKRQTARPNGYALSIPPFSPHDLRRSFSSGIRTHFKAAKGMIHAMIAHGSDDEDEIEYDKTLDMIYVISDESAEQYLLWQRWSDLIEETVRKSDKR
ncbi:tyrosine-type recombinase/integrase [Pseudomonas paracarnis]|uniref:tyrosine-type recombinase/integrase n=1 Tax=Pseudomonas paracarnis TaxID=2750625 RepID=UPI002938D691|nr:integrase arm-type DNA-binding domain-containing protein [Pseudomonas paracarnis]MDV3057796.1 integrase arm-type DNA-binding domain-containing protein [Pseudomonas paracarnis]